MKKMMLIVLVLCMAGFAQANQLSNGDFTLGENDPLDGNQPNELNAVDWDYWNGGGWNNRETNANGITPDDFHMALGNSGATDQGLYQVVDATEGLIYKLSVDAGSTDAWWKPNGEVKMEFLAEDGTVLDSVFTHWAMPDFDVVLDWANYSTTGTAPVGTTQIKALLMNQGPDGGTMRFDNAALEVIPEPTSMALLAVGALAAIRRKK